MRRRGRLLLLAAAGALLLAAAAALLPFARRVDVTLPAVEYRLDDADCAVARTVRIQGYDTRNLLGRGRFEGTLQVSGIDTGVFQTAHAAFPVSPGTPNV